MNLSQIAQFAFYVIITILAILFSVTQYRRATPAQKPKIIGAACGALAVGVLILVLLIFR